MVLTDPRPDEIPDFDVEDLDALGWDTDEYGPQMTVTLEQYLAAQQ